MQKNRKQWTRFECIVLAVLVLSSVIIAVGGISAKYIFVSGDYGAAVAPDFYFECDVLSQGGTAHKLNSGTESFEFSLKNHADSLRYSENDIQYQYTVTDSFDNIVDNGSGTLSGGASTEVSVTVDGLQDGETYTVTAKGSAGFTQTLTGTFTVSQGQPALYYHCDTTSNEFFITLTVWTEYLTGTVNVKFPTGLIPDNTCSGMENAKTAKGFFEDTQSFAIAYSSQAYRFFKTDEYSGGVFEISIGEILAEENTPS